MTYPLIAWSVYGLADVWLLLALFDALEWDSNAWYHTGYGLLGVVSQSPVREPLPLTPITGDGLALKGTGSLTFLKGLA
jgi:hypothetical protein